MERLGEVIPLFPGIRIRPEGATFKDLADSWLKSEGAKRVCPENEVRHVGHLEAIWDKTEVELRPRLVKEALAGLMEKLGPSTINKVRNTGRRIIKDAILNEEWNGKNPFDVISRLRETRPVTRTLSIEEARRVLPHLEESRRRQAYLMLYLGVRPGEMKALQRADVDTPAKTITIRRSNGRDKTKTGKERRVPIPERLWPHIEAALASTPPGCPLVFPGSGGERQRDDVKLSRVLKTALKAAELVTGFRYMCRRCGHKEERQTKEAARCPSCNMKLWTEGVPIGVRFYDLRHSAATLHRAAGADPLAIQIALGHAPESLTDSLYTHLTLDDIRRELNKLDI